MLFCVRGTSSTSRYVSTFIASSQGYNVREFSSRQLMKDTKPTVRSELLLEFLHCNGLSNLALTTKSNYVSNILRESTKSLKLQNDPVQFSLFFDDCDQNNVDNKNLTHHIPQEITQISYISPDKSRTHVNYTRNLIDIGTYTKDKTKVMNSVLSKNTLNIRQRSTNAPLAQRKETYKKEFDNNLDNVYDTLSLDLPQFFGKSLDYTIYHKDLEFVNNIRGTVSKGLFNYVKQMAFLRMLGHLKFAYIKLEILKITKHPEDNTVRVRWRIVGTTGMKVLFSIWKFKLSKIHDNLKEIETWYDGFSTFYIGDDGLIFRHVADKMIPDNNIEEKQKNALHELTFSNHRLKYY